MLSFKLTGETVVPSRKMIRYMCRILTTVLTKGEQILGLVSIVVERLGIGSQSCRYIFWCKGEGSFLEAQLPPAPCSLERIHLCLDK